MGKKMNKEEKQAYKHKLLAEITKHVGLSRKIGMGELYERVFEKPYAHRINDTRPLRTLIEELKQEHNIPIGSSESPTNGGYWLMASGSELDDRCRRLTNEATKKLAEVARLRKVTLPELMGQMALDFKPPMEAKNG